MSDSVVIVGEARTPIGRFRGELSAWSAPQLGAEAIKGAIRQAWSGKPPSVPESLAVAECLMGCVLPAGQGQAPARQAALGAGLALDTNCVTVNKMCGSGMQTVIQACQLLPRYAAADWMLVAGGMESMTNAPFMVRRDSATGKPEATDRPADHMFRDGLEDAYEPGRLMGTYAEDFAEKYQFTRSAQDEYAVESLENARRAQQDSAFDDEIVPLGATADDEQANIRIDELPRAANLDRIPTLKPAFREGGTVTAANSSAISDGAAALVLTTESTARKIDASIRARIVDYSSHADAPGLFPYAPVPAIQKLLKKAGWTVSDVDLWEVNEAFAVVPMVAMAELEIPRDRLNVNGGACALGHPIGASGARIIVTLLNAMAKRNATRGVAAICIGGGEATAIALERSQDR